MPTFRSNLLPPSLLSYNLNTGGKGSLVVKALCYKPEDRGLETRLGEWLFFINLPNPSGHTKPWGLLSLYQK
jgi:hypothetical protein